MEPILKCEKCASDHGDTEQIGIVCPSSPSCLTLLMLGHSVSSVNTLEEVKVAKGCLYVQVPVQEVCQHSPVPKSTMQTRPR